VGGYADHSHPSADHSHPAGLFSMVHPAALAPADLLADCKTQRQRRGGPGGQHRNKVETAVVITHRPTGAIGAASERRSQDLNRQAALHRLRIALALAIRCQVAPGSTPSSLWQQRFRGSKLAVSPQHDDFPALLAEALDRLASCDVDCTAAAGQLGISASRLVKFLRLEPAGLEWLNARRAEKGLLRLK
jgi:hypothetical protein